MTSRTFKPDATVDFAVVGSGAAGGILARELAQAGFSVLVFEQGPRLEAGNLEHEELKYYFLEVIVNKPEIAPQTFRNDPNKVAQRTELQNSLIYARIV